MEQSAGERQSIILRTLSPHDPLAFEENYKSQRDELEKVVGKIPNTTFVQSSSTFDGTNYILMEEVCIVSHSGVKKDNRFLHFLLSFYDQSEIIHFAEDELISSEDILMVEQHCFISLSKDTSEKGAQRFISIMKERNSQMDVTQVDLSGKNILSSVCSLNGSILLASEKISSMKEFEAFTKVTLKEDLEPFLRASVVLRNKVILPLELGQLKDQLASKGIEVVEHDLTGFQLSQKKIGNHPYVLKRQQKAVRVIEGFEAQKYANPRRQSASINCFHITYLTGALLEEATVNQTLNKLIDKHPYFRMTYFPEGEQLKYKMLKDPYQVKVEMVQVKDKQDQLYWIDKLYQEQVFPPEDSLLKVSLLVGNDEQVLILNYHHGVGDGVGGVILTNDFLSIYQKLSTQGNFVQESLEYIPSLVQLYKNMKFGPIQDPDDREYQLILPNCKTDYSSDKTVMKFFDGSKDSYQKIIAKTKAQAVTIGATLLTSLAWAELKTSMKRGITKFEGDKTINFKFVIPLNMRDRCGLNLGQEQVQYLISFAGIKFSISKETKFWESAKDVSEQCKRILENELPPKLLLVFTNMDPEGLQYVQSNAVSMNSSLSNIGRYSYPKSYSTSKGEVSVEKMYVGTDNSVSHYLSTIFYTHAVDYLTYTSGSSDLEEDQQITADIFQHFAGLHEKCHSLDDGYKFQLFLEE